MLPPDLRDLGRFIPVDTGSTIDNFCKGIFDAVYPRGYGEHALVAKALPVDFGLSPWIRGAHIVEFVQNQVERFIPVDTGSTLLLLVFSFQSPVYPRGYGEHAEAPDVVYAVVRFIPVDTGSTVLMAARPVVQLVYPRGYGEHIDLPSFLSHQFGLSPWIRGAPRNILSGREVKRFIPVDTGSTCVRRRANGRFSVYPRGYGEHSRSGYIQGKSSGLSPWIRGAHQLRF